MLDNETKRRIDTARDILVGKVPDPKSQVEQITIALVYKFMDDMDKESVAMGGKASFFTGDFERYAWSKIFDPKIGGHEMLGLYGEAIVKLNHNPNIPQLFRDIFKNAYLPYRDPETLKLFLKTINEFSYDHSERLGDAFEYLLSVLGSQGDAGQFRTPRHIIDFMVQIVDPQKHEMILDPACGTAGFLISSYKHIVRENTSPKLRSENGGNIGDLLTGEERKKLLTNFKGYDISPDMVRLSLVNLYLHGFVQPQILEYDTLTSEDRWNEYADVIMANPPFMSPKGGIKPHKKFSVQSNRSEVLFVDYIAEHLSPNGRAAVIVPEGIIFQSANAYKQLRKMLVENHLYAVVSLPAGIFNPYSGVKTSILLMDRQIAKKTDFILFVKIENDGFGLGAQRREQTGSDLPDAVNVIKVYVKAARSGALETFISEEKPCSALLVTKEKLAENEEYNLTADRYRTIEREGNQKWPLMEISELIDIVTPPKKLQTTEFLSNGKYPIIDQSQNEISGYSDDDSAVINENKPLVIFGDHTCSVKYLDRPFIQGADGIKILSVTEDLIPKYLYFLIKTKPIKSDGYKRHFSKLRETKIPLPPLEVQREIVTEIEGYQKLIDGARQVVESWKPQIEIDPEWPMVKLGDVCEIQRGKFSHRPRNEPRFFNGKYPFIQTGDVVRANGSIVGYSQTLNEEGLLVSKLFKPTIVLVTIAANIGDTAILNYEACFTDSVVGLIPKPYIDPYYLELIMRTKKNYLNLIAPQAAQKNINNEILRVVEFNLPPLEVQQSIVSKIEAERKIIDGCRELIKIYEDKIKRVIDKVWEE